MKLISHRGNIFGKNSTEENQPEYIQKAIESGFEVEIDVWYHDRTLWLGHDFPTYKTDETFLENEKLWCHLKNLSAIEVASKNKLIHWFWHQNDKVTITSKGIIWAFPGILVDNCVANQPSNIKEIFECQDKFIGICADDFSLVKDR